MTSRVKKILSIVIISVIVLITALTVILAIVPKRLYNPVTEGYYRVAVYKDGKDAGGYNLTGDMTDKEKDKTGSEICTFIFFVYSLKVKGYITHKAESSAKHNERAIHTCIGIFYQRKSSCQQIAKAGNRLKH